MWKGTVELLVEKPGPSLTTGEESIVDQIWAEELKKNPKLFNGKSTRYLSHALKNDRLQVRCCRTDYKHVLARIREPGIGIAALAVTGIIIDGEGNTLIGRRGEVTQYPGHYEIVTSGSMETPDPEAQIRKEFSEETGMDPSRIDTIEPFCLIHDEEHDVYDIGCIIRLNHKVRIRESDGEYTELMRVGIDELEGLMHERPFIPTSVALFEAFKEKN